MKWLARGHAGVVDDTAGRSADIEQAHDYGRKCVVMIVAPPLPIGRGYSTRMFPETVLTSSMKPPPPTLPSRSCLPKAPRTVTSRAV